MNRKPRELAMREERTRIRTVKRKLRQGRPGRLGDAMPPKFDWEKVTVASQKKSWYMGDNRKPKKARVA
jgi:hypothetical protein